MKKMFMQFLKGLALVTALIVIAECVLVYNAPQYVTPAFPYLLLFFLVVISVVHYILLKGCIEKPTKFYTYYMGTTIGKLMLYLIFLLTYILLCDNHDEKIHFLCTFIVLYLVYAGYESFIISVQTRKNNKSQKK